MANCQNCKSKCIPILDLGNQPICNRFLKSKSEFRKEKRYPLVLVFCPACSLVQLSVSLPTSIIFNKDFNYLSSSSKDVVTHYTSIAEDLTKKFRLRKGDFVVDVGSNDGVSLKPLKEKGISIIGVEPAPKPAEIANEQGILTLVEEFENAVDKVIKISHGKIKVISAFDVIAHTGSIHRFLAE